MTESRIDLNGDYVRRCFDLDVGTGALTWRERPESHFKSATAARRFNSRYAGRLVGASRSTTGYVRMRLDGRSVYVHRIVWLIAFGELTRDIDHINGDRADNRPANLRLATRRQNGANRKAGYGASGVKGVSVSRVGNYEARITVGKRKYYLGTFPNSRLAAKAYDEAARRYFGEFALTNEDLVTHAS